MRKVALMLAVMGLMGGGVCVAQEDGGVVEGAKDVVKTAWNVVPAVVTVANSTIHFVCGKVHDGLHSVAEWLKIEELP